MKALPRESYGAALESYRRHEAFFPLIGSVLEGHQDGQVYADAPTAPKCFYVEHGFGFAQIFGEASPAFDAALAHHLLEAKAFAAPKVRLYTPGHPAFLGAACCLPLRAFRQRFVLPSGADVACCEQGMTSESARAVPVTAENIAAVQHAFGVVDRFWRNAEDFMRFALPVVLWRGDAPAAICYAAAVSEKQAEIDVLTLPEYRGAGLGKMAVALFAARCRAEGMTPLWDCFTNNAGSMALCRSTGFVAVRSEYPFYTIAR